MVHLTTVFTIQTAAPYCDKDTTEDMASLAEKFQSLGERIDVAVQARKDAIKEQIDEVKEEITVLQEEREKCVAIPYLVFPSLT